VGNVYGNVNVGNLSGDLTISCDDEKQKALINFLKRGKFQSQAIILYTDTKKSVEEITLALLQNGFKSYGYHNGKSDSQKFEILNQFLKSPGIIVTTSGYELGVEKVAKGVIHYAIPKSVETYVQELRGWSHMFLSDEDYWRVRGALSEGVERE
jgi:superfamily II DNA helicase RecQ